MKSKSGPRAAPTRIELPARPLAPGAALAALLSMSCSGLDEPVEMAARVRTRDPKAARALPELARARVALPRGLGRPMKILAFAGDAAQAAAALAAGAALAGGDEMAAALARAGLSSVDGCVASITGMRFAELAAGSLGPRGLMPRACDGTLGQDLGELVARMRRGAPKFRLRLDGSATLPIGRTSMAPADLEANFEAALAAITELTGPEGFDRALVRTALGPTVWVDCSRAPSPRAERMDFSE